MVKKEKQPARGAGKGRNWRNKNGRKEGKKEERKEQSKWSERQALLRTPLSTVFSLILFKSSREMAPDLTFAGRAFGFLAPFPCA